jgi:heat shock protein HtpX
LHEQIAANKRKTFVLMLGFVVLVSLVGAAVVFLLSGGPIGFAIVVVLVAGAAVALYYNSEKAALTISHAKPADEQKYARLYNLVEGLCIASGMSAPRLFVVEDDAPNAFSVGRNPKQAAIAVTTGLLEKMNRLELEGILAHELSHIRNYDILPMTLAVSVVRVLVFPPVIAPVLQFAVSERREYDADASGAQLTRYPPGLISALEKLKDDTTSLQFASKATAHLWIEEPVVTGTQGSGRPNHLFDTHPPLDDRIRALQAM